MDVKYYKEQHHNYMVVHKTEDDSVVGYQQGMLIKRKMEYLLDTSLRSIDGENYNYYDISSKISLRQLFGSRYMVMDDIKQLIMNIRDACYEIDQYLLDSNRLILDPSYIFFSYSKSRYSFWYDVSNVVTSESTGMRDLMDYLLEKVSSSDNEATEFVYKCYEYYENGGLDVWELLMLLPQNKDDIDVIDVDSGEKIRDIIVDNVDLIDEQPIAKNSVYESGQVSCGNNTSSRWIFSILTIALGIIGVAVCAAIYYLCVLENDEINILLGVAATSLFIFVLGIVTSLLQLIKRRRGYMKAANGEENYGELEGRNIFGETGNVNRVHMDDFISRSGRSEWDNRKEIEDQGSDLDEIDGSQTVYFDPSPDTGIYKLFAMDRGNKQHISLDKFPCTIGKMSGYVDACIEHPSISRLHARIDTKDKKMFLQDLNSTNGVFLNGIRLGPNDEREIEEGDEIRLGSLNYCLRYIG